MIPVCEWNLFPGNAPHIIAGPCSAESRAQVLEVAESLSKMNPKPLMRCGLWKPRTSPDSFEGVGDKGIEWMLEARERYGIRICTEVANSNQAETCLKAGFDLLWLGARTTANPILTEELASALDGCEIPVLLKNPVNPDLDLWYGDVERFLRHSVTRLGVVHRGFSTLDNGIYRNSPQWQLVIKFRTRYPELPFFCDPSHIAGKSELVEDVCRIAFDLGLDSLMVEVHPDPSSALSDPRQQLTPSQFSSMMDRMRLRRSASEDMSYAVEMDRLRSRIDVLDATILSALSDRMAVSREIGECKSRNSVAVIQNDRWNALLARLRSEAAAQGLDPDFVQKIYELIHEASVEAQTSQRN